MVGNPLISMAGTQIVPQRLPDIRKWASELHSGCPICNLLTLLQNSRILPAAGALSWAN